MKPGSERSRSEAIERLAWYAHRLAAMGPLEVAHRVGEHVKRRVSKRRPGGWEAFACRLGPLPRLPLLHLDAFRGSADLSFLRSLAARIRGEGPMVLGRRVPPSTDPLRWHRDPLSGLSWPSESYCFDIAYRHDRARGDVKYVWELNRLQHLQPLAVVAAIDGDRDLARHCLAEIESWIDANPPFHGVNWASGIELALRAVSILHVVALCGTPDLVSPALADKIRAALNAHAAWLARFPSLHSSANNHLIAEAGGLFLIGTLAPDLPQAAEYAEAGRRILEREATLQILADGIGAEQTPTYAAFTLEWLLLAFVVGKESGRPLSNAVEARLRVAGEALRWMMDDAGGVPRIGDDDEGRVLVSGAEHEERYVASIASALAAVLDDPDLAPPPRSAPDLRGIAFGVADAKAASAPREGVRVFLHGGYTVVAERMAGRRARLVLDHGPVGYLSIAAHGHADALSVWLHVDGVPVLVDAGTFLYGSGGAWRDYFRSTAAHNTLTLDGCSSSDPAGAFNWRRKARAWRVADYRGGIIARHEGYQAAFGLVHERRVHVDRAAFVIEDRLLGEPTRPATPEIAFLVHPDLDVRREAGSVVIAGKEGPLVRLVPPEDVAVALARGETAPPRGWFSPRFGVKMPATQIVLKPTLWPLGAPVATRLEILGPMRG